MGLLYIATAVDNIAEVHLFDAIIDSMDEEEIAKGIMQIQPDLIGFSLKFAANIESTVKTVQIIKGYDYKGIIVMGGNTATFLYEHLLRNGFADVVVLHEGEQTFYELVKAIKEAGRSGYQARLYGVSGIAFRDGQGRIVRTKDRGFIDNIDSIPFPQRKYYDHFYRKSSSIYMFSSRGCCYSCFYCSTTRMWGNRWRGRSPENLVDEIKEVLNQYPNIHNFNFVDDNFLVSRTRVEKFIELIKKERLTDKTYNFSARPELLDADILSRLKSIGCSKIFLGIESGSPKILKYLNRRYSPAEIINKVDYAEKIGIEIVASFMIGLPFEESQDIDMTFTLIKEIPATNIQCHIFTPLPGTPCYDNHEAFGLDIKEHNPLEINLDSETFSTANLSKEQLRLLHRKALSLIRHKQFTRQLKPHDSYLRG
ncbi:B12-binding domain-containing radical SAM protein [Anaerobranca gottschalkii]|uniref:Radical SAM superfamily enzyme YgiQ, UPF0313 family n=1 Tax=Anaerobranca gottschalkii DSM 13577 TaxID=1120990 RepID=A0A1I0CBW2_9FIRM|nr:radical SAM protein [Anaerobranca gottschalkii]SET17043.1 Radical SAM superfamily enzyme YgiQ, UPF0313 family [Anaerobranca gottschalkii DSM 13577]